MPTLKLYIGKIFIDECELSYDDCPTLRDRERKNQITKRELAYDNRDILDMGFIPTFFLEIQSAMNDVEFEWTEDKVSDEVNSSHDNNQENGQEAA
jgi:hypothetical protein